MRKPTIYAIDNFDYEGRMDEDAYEDAIAAVESRRAVVVLLILFVPILLAMVAYAILMILYELYSFWM